eukprot:CAMPEP_0115586406 /NCGR_PEP_ID=MMETSP0272-20121206/7686_1 /TAXON_ID=71861 /ORGANISM="Scrippsiella trochoidea, Strain CCMP3099" /LENGTH=98 /DNA_ID=CAMNT_0003021477 /DNA_START=1007 /DNA_END=1300 /DNA_ORIENTATION=+
MSFDDNWPSASSSSFWPMVSMSPAASAAEAGLTEHSARHRACEAQRRDDRGTRQGPRPADPHEEPRVGGGRLDAPVRVWRLDGRACWQAAETAKGGVP